MSSPTGQHTEIRLCNRLDELDRLHALVAQFSSMSRSTEIAFALSLAIDELVTNVILRRSPSPARLCQDPALSRTRHDR